MGVAAAGVSMAAPLEKEACTELKSEQSALATGGLRADMARGAAWAKGNLGPDRLKRIARLIEVDEQILFRCPAPPPDVEAAAKPTPKPQAARKAIPVSGDGHKPKVTGTKAGNGAVAETPGGKLEPQSANASSNASDKPKKPAKAEVAAEKKRAAAAAKAQAKIKPGDAFISPPGAPISTLQAPAATERPQGQ